MLEQERVNPADSFAGGVLKVRAGVLHGIEQLIRFCELLLLAGAFAYAASKTKDGFLALLAFLLSGAALIYMAEFFVWSTRNISLPPKRGWWRWTFGLLFLAYMFWIVTKSTANVSNSITVLANATVQL